MRLFERDYENRYLVCLIFNEKLVKNQRMKFATKGRMISNIINYLTLLFLLNDVADFLESSASNHVQLGHLHGGRNQDVANFFHDFPKNQNRTRARASESLLTCDNKWFGCISPFPWFIPPVGLAALLCDYDMC